MFFPSTTIRHDRNFSFSPAKENRLAYTFMETMGKFGDSIAEKGGKAWKFAKIVTFPVRAPFMPVKWGAQAVWWAGEKTLVKPGKFGYYTGKEGLGGVKDAVGGSAMTLGDTTLQYYKAHLWTIPINGVKSVFSVPYNVLAAPFRAIPAGLEAVKKGATNAWEAAKSIGNLEVGAAIDKTREAIRETFWTPTKKTLGPIFKYPNIMAREEVASVLRFPYSIVPMIEHTREGLGRMWNAPGVGWQFATAAAPAPAR